MSGNDFSEREWILGMGGGNFTRLTENGTENQYFFKDRVLRNERYKLYIGPDREPKKIFDLKNDPLEYDHIIDSLDTSGRRGNFERLRQVVKSFPKEDSDQNTFQTQINLGTSR